MPKRPELFIHEVLHIKYEYFENNPNNLYKKENKIKGYCDCTVRAFCKISGLGWSTVFDMLLKEATKKHDMPNVELVENAVAAHLGFRHKKINSSVIAFIVKHPKGTYAIAIYGHIFAYIDNTIYDCNHDGKPMDGYDLDAILLAPIDRVYYKYTDTLNL